MATSKLILDLIARDNASKTFRQLGIAADGTVNKMTLLNKAGNQAALGLAAWSAAALLSVRNAAEDEEAQRKLALSIKNATGASDAQIASVEDLIYKMELASGVSDDELRPAMNQLVISTGNVAESEKLLQVALDASAATGKSLSTVAIALGKAYNGNVSSLGRLGFAYKDAKGEAMSYEEMIQRIIESTQGQAAAVGDASPWKRLQVLLDETKESIGAGLLPEVRVLTEALTAIPSPVIAAGFTLTGLGLATTAAVPKVIGLRKAIEGITWAEKAYSVTTKTAAAATIGLIGAFAGGAAAEAAGFGRTIDENADSVADLGDQLEAVLAPSNSIKVGEFIDGISSSLTGMRSQLDADVDSLGAFDDQLAGMVSSGNAKAAAAQWAELVRWGEEHGVTLETLVDRFPKYVSAVEEAAGSNSKAAIATQHVSDAMANLDKVLQRTKDSWQAYIGLPLDAAEAEMSYQQAAATTAETLADEEKTRLDKRSAIADEIRALESLREAQISDGVSVKAANATYNAHIKALRQAAEDAGLLRGKTDDLAAALRRLPSAVKIGVQLTMDTAHNEVVISTTAGNRRVLDATVMANGGSVFAPRAAAGRYVVGEYGPELLTLTATGGRITPHSRSVRRLGGDGPTIIQNFNAPVDAVAVGRETHRALLAYRRVVGGASLGLG